MPHYEDSAIRKAAKEYLKQQTPDVNGFVEAFKENFINDFKDFVKTGALGPSYTTEGGKYFAALINDLSNYKEFNIRFKEVNIDTKGQFSASKWEAVVKAIIRNENDANDYIKYVKDKVMPKQETAVMSKPLVSVGRVAVEQVDANKDTLKKMDAQLNTIIYASTIHAQANVVKPEKSTKKSSIISTFFTKPSEKKIEEKEKQNDILESTVSMAATEIGLCIKELAVNNFSFTFDEKAQMLLVGKLNKAINTLENEYKNIDSQVLGQTINEMKLFLEKVKPETDKKPRI